MDKLKKLTISTTSGYRPYNYAYEDKMVITENSITYVNKPVYPDGIYAPVKWSYKSDSKSFRDWFDEIDKIYEACLLNVPLDDFVTDVGEIRFTFVFEDGERQSSEFPFTGYFDELLRFLLKMVPAEEETPVMLLNI